MNTTPSSTSSAKDDLDLLDLNEMALAMYADSLGLTDKEYEELRAIHRKRKQRVKLGEIAAGALAGAFLCLSIAAIYVAATHWGWQ